MKNFKNIDAYIKSYPKDVQNILEKIRMTIKKSAPKAEEVIKYGIPTFVQNGNLVHFGAYKHHIGFYPTPAGILAFKKELSAYKKSKGTIQFQLDEPIPFVLVGKITKLRVKQNTEKKISKSKKEYTHYHKDGSLYAKGSMVDGTMDGYWEWFRKDGSKMRSGHFKKGKQVGVWITYDKKGEVYKKMTIKK